jgi:hypothetical protein
MTTVTTKCQNCGAEFQTEYQLIGAPVACNKCHQETVPQIPNGTPKPCHEWELTFRDFRQLVEDPAYRPEIAPLLDGWSGYRLAGAGRDTLILNKMNEAIDPLSLHLEIQSDADKQYKLYQTAMSLWR